MDKPKAPDDARSWSAIEIFLFTNGQEYTPPRKYYLKAEELTWWDATLGVLACSQFGSLDSNIELFTLDGKKITTPLDLTNDAAYVAVKPPDAFIQTGYEKYLLRASRSWEKRHEKLNNKETAQTGNNEENKKHAKPNLKTPGDKTAENEKNVENELQTEIEINTSTQFMKGNESRQHTDTTKNPVNVEKPELLQRWKPENNTKSTILKNIYPYPKSKENGLNFNKKRTTSFPKNLIKSSNNSKSFTTTSSNNTNILKNKIKWMAKSKDEHQSNNTETAKNIKEINKKSDQLRKDPVIKKSPGISMKDFTVISDVYKNAENDRQSVFLDADRKTGLLCNDHTELPRALESIHELGETPKKCLQTNETISQRSASNLSELQALQIVTQPGTLNINLNIGLKGYNRFKTDEKLHANKCKTFIKHINPEKASQVNVDINLSRETLNFEDEVLLHDQPLEAGLAETCDRKIVDNKCKVHCKCDVMKPENTPYDFNDTDNYIIVIPTEKFDKLLSRSGVQPRRGSDKEIQELIKSYIRVPISNSEIVPNNKLDYVTRHKVPISKDAPLELFDSENIMHFQSQGDTKQSQFINELNKPNCKIENFTQTAWSNLLLQVKCHEDGRYTFNLPTLHLLAQYNLL